MCHDKHLLNTEKINQRNYVTSNMKASVASEWAARDFSVAVAAKIRGNGTVAEAA